MEAAPLVGARRPNTSGDGDGLARLQLNRQLFPLHSARTSRSAVDPSRKSPRDQRGEELTGTKVLWDYIRRMSQRLEAVEDLCTNVLTVLVQADLLDVTTPDGCLWKDDGVSDMHLSTADGSDAMNDISSIPSCGWSPRSINATPIPMEKLPTLEDADTLVVQDEDDQHLEAVRQRLLRIHAALSRYEDQPKAEGLDHGAGGPQYLNVVHNIDEDVPSPERMVSFQSSFVQQRHHVCISSPRKVFNQTDAAALMLNVDLSLDISASHTPRTDFSASCIEQTPRSEDVSRIATRDAEVQKMVDGADVVYGGVMIEESWSASTQCFRSIMPEESRHTAHCGSSPRLPRSHSSKRPRPQAESRLWSPPPLPPKKAVGVNVTSPFRSSVSWRPKALDEVYLMPSLPETATAHPAKQYGCPASAGCETSFGSDAMEPTPVTQVHWSLPKHCRSQGPSGIAGAAKGLLTQWHMTQLENAERGPWRLMGASEVAREEQMRSRDQVARLEGMQQRPPSVPASPNQVVEAVQISAMPRVPKLPTLMSQASPGPLSAASTPDKMSYLHVVSV